MWRRFGRFPALVACVVERGDVTTTRIFHSFALFDGVNSQVRPDCWLEVADGCIRRVGGGPHPRSGEAVDLGGRTVIPGLIDAHVHLAYPFTTKLDPVSALAATPQMKLNLANCIRSGVTTVRDLACTPGLMRKMKGWIKKGDAIGPRIVCANAAISLPQGYPEFVPTYPWPLNHLMGGQVIERARTPNQVQDAVRRMVAQDADWVKTMHTDRSIWLNRPDPPIFDDACFEALVDEARKLDRPVAMHHLWASGFRKAVELGVDSIEHAPLDTLTNEDIARMVDAGVSIVPTLEVIASIVDLPDWLDTAEGEDYLCPEPLKQTRGILAIYRGGITPEMAKKEYYDDLSKLPRRFSAMMENVGRLHRTGATIGCGTDSGGAPFAVFGRIHAEIDNLMKVGMTPFEALRSATAVNARILHLDAKLGTIEPGKLADFVALDGDPLRDTTALQRVQAVVKDGAIVHWRGK
jgi:imidazolonepropionase-like amidohydrolase